MNIIREKDSKNCLTKPGIIAFGAMGFADIGSH